jgi:hypothetical protein
MEFNRISSREITLKFDDKNEYDLWVVRQVENFVDHPLTIPTGTTLGFNKDQENVTRRTT